MPYDAAAHGRLRAGAGPNCSVISIVDPAFLSHDAVTESGGLLGLTPTVE